MYSYSSVENIGLSLLTFGETPFGTVTRKQSALMKQSKDTIWGHILPYNL
jgi:hypothetical protein